MRIRRTHGAMAVGVVLEDGFPAVAAIDDVINGARIFNAKFAGHECWLAQRPASRQRHDNMIIFRAVGFLSKYDNTMDGPGSNTFFTQPRVATGRWTSPRPGGMMEALL